MADVILAAGWYDASDNLVADWDTLVTTYGMDIAADQGADISDSAPCNVLCNDALAAGSKLIIPDGVTHIGASAFMMLDTLTNITIPSSVVSIGESAFRACLGLVSIIIPNGVTVINPTTFNNCSSLARVEIPVSVVSVGESAFNLCPALTDVHYGGTAEQWGAISIGEYNTYLTDATIHYADNTEEETPDVEEKTAVAVIIYKDKPLESIAAGEYVTLCTNGKQMEDDIRVEAVGGGGDSPLPLEIATAEEMAALLETAEIGSVYKYVGETTAIYENGALYIVSEE